MVNQWSGILTFHEPFKNTSNAYFACWVALLVSMLLGVDSYAAMHVAWKQYEDAAADLTTYFLLIMLLASFVRSSAPLPPPPPRRKPPPPHHLAPPRPPRCPARQVLFLASLDYVSDSSLGDDEDRR